MVKIELNFEAQDLNFEELVEVQRALLPFMTDAVQTVKAYDGKQDVSVTALCKCAYDERLVAEIECLADHASTMTMSLFESDVTDVLVKMTFAQAVAGKEVIASVMKLPNYRIELEIGDGVAKTVSPPSATGIMIDGVPATAIQIEGLNKKLDQLECSTRLRNILRSTNLVYMGSIALQTESEFDEIEGTGPFVMMEVRDNLTVHDLAFGKRIEGWTAPEEA